MMKTFASSALAVVLLAAPAFAQSTGSEGDMSRQESGQAGGNQGQQQQQAGQQDGAQDQRQGGMQDQDEAGRTGGMQDGQQAGRNGMTAKQMVTSQRRVIRALNQAGFTDVQIMDAAYLVSATTDNDEQVMMVVNSAGQPVRSSQGRTTQ